MYTLMRYHLIEHKKYFMVDLYDHKNKKGVELQYNLYHKTIDKQIGETLHNLLYKTIDLNTLDNIIQLFIREQ